METQFCCCTSCYKNFKKEVWEENRGCLFCKWDKIGTSFQKLGFVKTGDPWPCCIPNKRGILINGKLSELV
jgi:hypothetical protein